MVKQTKKGSIGKKALSAILAASMIMTSSSFVMAGPVVEEVEAVAVEEVAAEAVEETNISEDLTKAALDNDELTASLIDADAFEFDGTEKKPKADIAYAGADLIEGVDYVLTYSDNINAGEATVKVTYKGAYETLNQVAEEDKKELTFNISKIDISATSGKLIIDADDTKAFPYTGKTVVPTVNSVVWVNAKGVQIPLSADDYEVVTAIADRGLINCGLKSVKIQAKDTSKNFEGAATDAFTSYTITKVDASEELLSLNKPTLVYAAGGADRTANVKAAIEVKDKNRNEELTQDTDYTVKFRKAGTKAWLDTAEGAIGDYEYQITINNAKNYVKDSTLTGTYKIVADETLDMYTPSVSGFSLKDDVFTATYNGVDKLLKKDANDKYAGLVLTKGNTTLTEGIDYTVSITDAEWKNAGEYSITVTGIGAFSGTRVIPVKVLPKNLNKTNKETLNTGIEATASFGTTRDGKASEIVVKVTDTIEGEEVVLENGKDYTYTTSVDTKEDPAVATVVITGIGNYTTDLGEKSTVKTLELESEQDEKLSLSDPSVSASLVSEITYGGTAINLQTSDFKVVNTYGANTYTLTEKDFYVDGYKFNNTPSNKINRAGEWTVTLTAYSTNQYYSGSVDVVIDVKGKSFADDFKLDTSAWKSATYNGGSKVTDIPEVVVRYVSNNAPISESNNYEVKYYFEGKEIKEDEITKVGTYTVEVLPGMGLSKYSGKLTATFEVVGKDIAKEIEVEAIKAQDYTGSAIEPEVKITPATLVEGKDYSVTYENNVKVGEARVIITGLGNYSGKVIVPFNIVGEMDQPIEVLPAQEKALQSRTLNDKATKVKYTTAPETTVTYKSSDEDVVTVDAEGNIKYTGLGEATITIEAAAENGYKAATKELKVVVGLKQPTFSPSSKNNAFTVTTSTVKGAEKFQVQYVPTGKSFTSKAAKSKTFTVDNKLKKGKISAANKETYRIRVRAINGDTKSKWSPVKTIATK